MTSVSAISAARICIICSLLGAASPLQADAPLPPLQNGDLVFQTSTSSQSAAILAATGSPFTHMGIIRLAANGVFVIEAAGTVTETPLADWIARGVQDRVAIYRDPALPPADAERVVTEALQYVGRPYDIFFSFGNDAIYCSELPYLAYRQVGISLGAVQTLADLNFDTPAVRALIADRWQRHSECTVQGLGFDDCYTYILTQDMVTPAAIANDPQLTLIYSDFP
jgi:hypothetical protein